jgi:hypothetical protein
MERGTADRNVSSGGRNRRRLLWGGISLGIIAAVIVAIIAWLGAKASLIERELEASVQLVAPLKDSIAGNRTDEVQVLVRRLQSHTSAAKEAAGDSMWTLAASIPAIGDNFAAVAEIARSADDVATLGVAPLAETMDLVNLDGLLPSNAGTKLQPIREAAPKVAAAVHAVDVSTERLNGIDTHNLLPQIAEPLERAREQLNGVTASLEGLADATRLAPEMLGANGPRTYLLIVQNNAETRATGGIPGALATLSVDKGRVSLGDQTSASGVGPTTPPVAVAAEQEEIYSARMGKFVQDINLTPDFPTSASTMQAIWERKTGKLVDGVISIDPIALAYVLAATGPVKVNSPELINLAGDRLPVVLNSQNVVKTLLSDVYAKIEQPELQDVYFAGVAKEIFDALSSGRSDAKALVQGLSRATAEGRVLIWSRSGGEESVLTKYRVGGSITGGSISPSQFGVYFNDGTGAKMDYYVTRTVQLIKQCTQDGYAEVKVRVTSKNIAPRDAATSLPAYVTGGGAFGVPAGTVQTNIVAYGPVQSNVEEAHIEGKKTGFASQRHAGRPVGTVTVRLAPGQSSTVEFTFGKIVQHTEPEVAVTPTVQALKDVVLKAKTATCSPHA